SNTTPSSNTNSTNNIKQNQIQSPSEEPKIISRSEWGAKTPNTSPTTVGGKPKTYADIPTNNLSFYYHSIVIHHTGNLNNNPTPNKIQNEQMKESYADVAYHFLIDKDGNIYEGRPLDKMQAHVAGEHHGLIGIALLGDFDSTNEGLTGNPFIKILKQAAEYALGDSKISDKMVEALFNLVQYLNQEYGIKYFGGHKEFQEVLNIEG